MPGPEVPRGLGRRRRAGTGGVESVGDGSDPGCAFTERQTSPSGVDPRRVVVEEGPATQEFRAAWRAAIRAVTVCSCAAASVAARAAAARVVSAATAADRSAATVAGTSDSCGSSTPAACANGSGRPAPGRRRPPPRPARRGGGRRARRPSGRRPGCRTATAGACAVPRRVTAGTARTRLGQHDGLQELCLVEPDDPGDLGADLGDARRHRLPHGVGRTGERRSWADACCLTVPDPRCFGRSYCGVRRTRYTPAPVSKTSSTYGSTAGRRAGCGAGRCSRRRRRARRTGRTPPRR